MRFALFALLLVLGLVATLVAGQFTEDDKVCKDKMTKSRECLQCCVEHGFDYELSNRACTVRRACVCVADAGPMISSTSTNKPSVQIT